MALVDKSVLTRWRDLDAAVVLRALADRLKPDPTYVPIKSPQSRRWHANVRGRDFELLLTGTKFWDTRERVGGGGAVDLAMHVADVDFAGAVSLLKQRNI